MERKSLLNQVIEKCSLIKKEESFIDDEQAKFNRKVANAKKTLETYNKEIKALGETIIPVNVETLVEVIAEEIGVDVKDLEVDVYFEHAVKGKLSKKNLIQYWKYNQCVADAIFVDLVITSKEKGYNVSYKRCLKLNQHQKDGSKLIDFLEVETKRNGLINETNFVCPDYKNLRFYYRLKELIRIDEGKIYSPYIGKIYEAYERDKEKRYSKNI